jgi:diaminopimelate decarboxylase
MSNEKQTNLPEVLEETLKELKEYNMQNQKDIKLEIEPGSYFVANHGYIVTRVDDIIDTGVDGYNFIKTTTGMDMILRPSLYQAQHPIYHYSITHQQWSKI